MKSSENCRMAFEIKKEYRDKFTLLCKEEESDPSKELRKFIKDKIKQ